MDQFDPWQVVPRQVFTPYSRLLISTAFVVVNRVGCLGITGVLCHKTRLSKVMKVMMIGFMTRNANCNKYTKRMIYKKNCSKVSVIHALDGSLSSFFITANSILQQNL